MIASKVARNAGRKREQPVAQKAEQMWFDNALDDAEHAMAELAVQSRDVNDGSEWAASRSRRVAGMATLLQSLSEAIAPRAGGAPVRLGPGGDFVRDLEASSSIVARVIARLKPWQRPVPGREAGEGDEARRRREADFGPYAAHLDHALGLDRGVKGAVL